MPTRIINNDDPPSMPGRLVENTHRCSSPAWNARKKGKVLVPEDIPTYGEIKEDTSGSAIVPCNFLPAIIEKLPDDWYYRTYPYYKYFDKNQRDCDGKVTASTELSTANPSNVKKWRVLMRSIFGDTFKEEGKYRYGLEVGRMAMMDGIQCGGARGGRSPDTSNLAMSVLFGDLTTELLSRDAIGQLIAYGFKWIHVPNLEGNSQWVKDALGAYFRQLGAKVALSDKLTEKKISQHRQDLQEVWNAKRD